MQVLAQKNLEVKTSGIQNSGKGLFTKIFIPRGTFIIEYTGKITSWADAHHDDGTNAYLYYVNKNHVIDASKRLTSLARYANDARGLTRIEGLTNNTAYVITHDKRVYIKAIRNIPANTEILVNYSKSYWDLVKKYREEAAGELR